MVLCCNNTDHPSIYTKNTLSRPDKVISMFDYMEYCQSGQLNPDVRR